MLKEHDVVTGQDLSEKSFGFSKDELTLFSKSSEAGLDLITVSTALLSGKRQVPFFV